MRSRRVGSLISLVILLAGCETTAPRKELVFAQVSAGTTHTCGTTVSGAGYCWGVGENGELGNGKRITSSSPVAVSGGLTFRSLSAGGNNIWGWNRTCGVITSGAGYCWGHEALSVLADDTVPTPVRGGLTLHSVGVGSGEMCALSTSGVAYCWGNLSVGFDPAPVPLAPSFQSLSVGSHACGLTPGGAAYCWGDGGGGQLGDGADTSATSPVPVAGGLTFQSISAGGGHTCGVTTGGVGYCWGTNDNGELGNGTTAWASSPVPVEGGLTFQAMSAGPSQSCGLTTSAAAYCWGANYYGELGNGASVNGSTQRVSHPVPVAGGLTFQSISAGGYHTCGLTTAGAVYCWGNNTYGELGDGTTENSPRPVRVVGAR